MPSDKIVHNDVEQQTSQEHIAEIFCGGNILSTTFSSQIIDELKDIDDLQQVISILKVKVGDNILQSKQLFNVINDLTKVFREFPQYKYILKGLIDWQLFSITRLQKLTEIQIREEANKFAIKTGFNNKLVLEIFIAMAIGMQGKSLSTSRIGDDNTDIQKEQLNKEKIAIDDKQEENISSCDFICPFISDPIVKVLNTDTIVGNQSGSSLAKFYIQKMYLVPKWNEDAGIKINNFDILSATSNCFSIEYKITNTHPTNHPVCDVYIIAVDKNGVPMFKDLLTFIPTSKKFAVEQGQKDFYLELSHLGAIFILPMCSSIDNRYDSRTFFNSHNYKKFSGLIENDIQVNRYHFSVQTPHIYGFHNECLIVIPFAGKTTNSNFWISSFVMFDVVLFNANDEPIESLEIDLRDIDEWHGLKHLYLKNFKLSCEYLNIKKVIISERF